MTKMDDFLKELDASWDDEEESGVNYAEAIVGLRERVEGVRGMIKLTGLSPIEFVSSADNFVAANLVMIMSGADVGQAALIILMACILEQDGVPNLLGGNDE